MMGSNNPGGAGGGMAPGMGAGGSDGRHDDEAVLTEFLSSLMDYNPMIPDELVEHYLGRSGFHCPDLRLTRLVAVATQKFISDVASDSLQHCKARVAAPIKDNKSKQPKDRRLVLTIDDLSKALRELFRGCPKTLIRKVLMELGENYPPLPPLQLLGGTASKWIWWSGAVPNRPLAYLRCCHVIYSQHV